MFIFELDADVSDIERIVAAADADDERYRLDISTEDDHWHFEKKTLLVYDASGQLLESWSLIPGSVEL